MLLDGMALDGGGNARVNDGQLEKEGGVEAFGGSHRHNNLRGSSRHHSSNASEPVEAMGDDGEETIEEEKQALVVPLVPAGDDEITAVLTK